MRMQGKVAVITGGNSGIGLAVARAFHDEGAHVVIFGRDPTTLISAHAEIGERTVTVRGDVRRLGDLDKLYATVEERFGGVDVVVASAGIQGPWRMEEVDEDYFDRVMGTNLKGTYFTVQKAVPLLSEGASVILISSVAGKVSPTETGVYAASKAAVATLARSFAADLVERGIRVNSISPGFTLTPTLKNQGAEVVAARTRLVPMGRLARPEEIAQAALFLATDSSSYVTGANLDVDGGVSSIFLDSVGVRPGNL